MLKKILLSKAKPVQLAFSLAGTTLGLVIMMTGIQLWTDVRHIMAEHDMLGDDYIVISKKVNLVNTLGGGPGRFSEEDIAELKAVKGITDVGAFTPGKFRATMELSAQIGDFGGQMLKTEMFFEAVPDQFMDIAAASWSWTKGQKTVPIVIPADIIKQYNHAFAASQGLPVVPESMLRDIEFDLHLRGNDKSETVRGRIAGFSNRINSILVPQAFLDYGNREYGDGKKPSPSRLILHATDPAAPEIVRFFQDKGYDLNEEKLKASRTNMLLQLVMLLVAVLGIFITILALLGFIQYTQLMAYRSAWEIQTLHWLGYEMKVIRAPFDKFAFQNLLISFSAALLVFGAGQIMLISAFQSRGFNVAWQGWYWALPAGLLTAGLMWFTSRSTVKKQVETLAL